MGEKVLYRGQPAELLEHREAQSIKGKRFPIVVIRTAKWDRLCALPSEIEHDLTGQQDRPTERTDDER